MNSYYFTFGSDERFPYPNRYLIVKAESIVQAIAIFRAVHPDRDPELPIYNASDCYTEAQWDEHVSKYYGNRAAAEVISLTIDKPSTNR